MYCTEYVFSYGYVTYIIVNLQSVSSFKLAVSMAAGPGQLPQGTARFAQQQPGGQQAGSAGGALSPPAQQSQPVSRQLLQNLPLQMDPVLASSATTHQLSKRQLGENFDQRLNFTHNHFVSTADNKNILACGFWDNSFRAFSTDSGINTITHKMWLPLTYSII